MSMALAPSHAARCSAAACAAIERSRTSSLGSVGLSPHVMPAATVSRLSLYLSANAWYASQVFSVVSTLSTPLVATASSIALKPADFAWDMASSMGASPLPGGGTMDQ
jgi:hypothetical protein